MKEITQEDDAAAVQTINSLIARCERIFPQFADGTSQHTLLVNRLSALRVGQALMTRSDEVPLSRKELEAARAPLASILHKCERAITKHAPGSVTYTKLEEQMRAMRVALARIEEINADRRD